MNINEYANITDSKIRGIVILKDSSGNIILKKENMIVESGRKFIRDIFLANAITATKGHSGAFSSYSLTHISFGSSDVATQANMTKLADETFSVEIEKKDVIIVDNSVSFHFKATIDKTNHDTGVTIKEIGLTMTKNNFAEPLLFSRVVFDAIPVAAGEKYEVNYHIYF